MHKKRIEFYAEEHCCREHRAEVDPTSDPHIRVSTPRLQPLSLPVMEETELGKKSQINHYYGSRHKTLREIAFLNA